MRPNTLRTLRRYHLYLGLFFAPMILLFAVSGALQTFRLNEAKGYGGTPPTWMVWLASVHKDQGPPRDKPDKPRSATSAIDEHDHGDADHPSKATGARDGAVAAKRPDPLPLKIFVVVLAIALALSTILGIVIATAARATRWISLILLAVGTVVPIVLLWV